MPNGTANELTLPVTRDILAAKSWATVREASSKAASQLTLAPMALKVPPCNSMLAGCGTMRMTGSLAKTAIGSRKKSIVRVVRILSMIQYDNRC